MSIDRSDGSKYRKGRSVRDKKGAGFRVPPAKQEEFHDLHLILGTGYGGAAETYRLHGSLQHST